MKCERLREAIPWYVNGTLDAAATAELESHIAGCADCARLSAHARLQSDHVDAVRAAGRSHVPAGLLVRFVEQRAELTAETAGWIDGHLRECDACTAEAQLLREVATGTVNEATVAGWRRWFAGLLQPAPALVYLLLLAIAAPFVWRGLESPVPGGPGAPRVLDAPAAPLTTESARRGEDPPPPEIVTAAPGPRRVDLDLEWTRVDLGGVAALRVELRSAETTVQSLIRSTAELGEIPGGLRITLWVDYGEGSGNNVYEWTVRAEQAGDPLDGQLLFRRRIRVVP